MSDDGVAERQKRSAADGGKATPGSGAGLAALALLLALAAVGLAGYPYYQKGLGAAPPVAMPAALDSGHEDDAAELRRALNDAITGLDDRLLQQQTRQSVRLDEQDARIDARSLADTTATAASTARLANSLRLTEVEYLLQGANHRLLLQRDAPGALAMLLAAQQVLEQVAEPAVFGVRAKLNDEITALRSEGAVDVNATFVRLERLKQDLPELPSGFAATSLVVPADAVAGSLWQQALHKLLSLFEFRRNGGDGAAALTVDAVVHLRLNLELLLQTAQLALLRNDAAVYRQSLTTARTSLDDYRRNNGVEVVNVQAEIDQLLGLPLQHALPDLSGSLIELRSVVAAGAENKLTPPPTRVGATDVSVDEAVESTPPPESGAAP